MTLNPDSLNELKLLAANIRLARKRRKISVKLLAEKSGISTSTITRLEAADPTVAIGTVLQILSALNLVEGLSLIAAPENDLRQTIEEVRALRLQKTLRAKERFSEKELDF